MLFDIALLCQANFQPCVNLSCNDVDTVVCIYFVEEMYSFQPATECVIRLTMHIFDSILAFSGRKYSHFFCIELLKCQMYDKYLKGNGFLMLSLNLIDSEVYGKL